MDTPTAWIATGFEGRGFAARRYRPREPRQFEPGRRTYGRLASPRRGPNPDHSMSAWRMAARALYELGGAADYRTLILKVVEPSALRRLLSLGLAVNGGRKHPTNEWALTSLGVAWCEGRVQAKPGPRWLGARTRFVATWLAAHPLAPVIRAQRSGLAPQEDRNDAPRT